MGKSQSDYVKYKITIKNNTKGIMKIDEVIDSYISIGNSTEKTVEDNSLMEIPKEKIW